MNWQEVKTAFEDDGSFIDLYVLDASLEVWQSALDFLRVGSYPLCYIVDTDETEMPANAESIFSRSLEASIFLKVNVNGIIIVFHFFDDEEIEFDVDSRDITNEAQFNFLCDFMRGMGRHLGRSIILTPESSQDRVIIRYLPSEDQFVYTPLPLWTPIGTIP